MAATSKNTKTKKTTTKAKVVKEEVQVEEPILNIETEDVESEKEQVVVEPKATKEVRKFNNEDLIPCICAFPGSVGMSGKRSGNTYLWEDMGVVENVEYQDLRSEVLNKKSAYIYKPLIIVADEDFLAQNASLAKMYKDIYTPDEIVTKIKKATPEEMRKFIIALPAGIQDNVKSIAATMIKEGSLDSVKKIKVLDDIFGTNLTMYSQFFTNEE